VFQEIKGLKQLGENTSNKMKRRKYSAEHHKKKKKKGRGRKKRKKGIKRPV